MKRKVEQNLKNEEIIKIRKGEKNKKGKNVTKNWGKCNKIKNETFFKK